MPGLVLGGVALQAYFRINYFLFVLLTTVVCMVLNPSSLIVLGLLATTWFYLFVARQASITIGGRAFRCTPPAGMIPLGRPPNHDCSGMCSWSQCRPSAC